MGPDIGDTIDIGKVVASKDAATLDIVANSLMKNAYDHLGDPKPGSRPNHDLVNIMKNGVDWLKNKDNRDTPMEYFYGRTLLEKNATAFDTLQIRAAMAYGITPLGIDQIKFTTGSATDPALGRIKDPK